MENPLPAGFLFGAKGMKVPRKILNIRRERTDETQINEGLLKDRSFRGRCGRSTMKLSYLLY